LADSGQVAVVSQISPERGAREAVRRAHKEAGLRFVEVFVDTPLEVCEQRDPKGLYARARAGEISGFPGIDSPYEEPLAPDLHLTVADGPVKEMARRVLAAIEGATVAVHG